MMDVTHGAERVRAWPKKRGRVTDPVTKAQNQTFLEYQWATKYWPARFQAEMAEAVKGTPLMPRDIMTMIMAGRFCAVKLDDGRLIYSMAARQDVSESLDILSQIKGTLLFRSQDWWQGLAPPTDAGQVLGFDNVTETPQWVPNGGGGGGGGGLFSVTAPPAALTTWINQGTSTVAANADGTLTLSSALDGADNIRGLFMPLPAPPWTHTIGWMPSLFGANYQGCGVALRESASGKMIVFVSWRDTDSGALWVVANYNSPTSKNANVIVTAAPTSMIQPVYLKIGDDGVHRTASFGFDPYSQPYAPYSQLTGTFINPDQIGIFTENINATLRTHQTVFSWL